MAEWYYSSGGQQLGPVSRDQLQQLARAGQLQPSDLVWKDGMTDWKPAGTIDGLLGAAAAPVGVVQQPAEPAPPGDWYYSKGGQQLGPVSSEQLRTLAQSGQLQATDLVWKDGMPDWQAAGVVPGLLPAGAAVPNYMQAGYQGAGAYPQAGSQYGGYPQPGANMGGTGTIGYYTPPQTFVYANFGWRLLAFLIDTVVTMIAGGVIGGIAGFVLGSAQADAQAIQLVAQLLGTIVAWLYYALQESSAAQATLGKRACGLRVVDMSGNRISFGRATGRYFAKIISGCLLLVGYIMAAFTEKRQALHDMMAGTLVIKVS